MLDWRMEEREGRGETGRGGGVGRGGVGTTLDVVGRWLDDGALEEGAEETGDEEDELGSLEG